MISAGCRRWRGLEEAVGKRRPAHAFGPRSPSLRPGPVPAARGLETPEHRPATAGYRHLPAVLRPEAVLRRFETAVRRRLPVARRTPTAVRSLETLAQSLLTPAHSLETADQSLETALPIPGPADHGLQTLARDLPPRLRRQPAVVHTLGTAARRLWTAAESPEAGILGLRVGPRGKVSGTGKAGARPPGILDEQHLRRVYYEAGPADTRYDPEMDIVEHFLPLSASLPDLGGEAVELREDLLPPEASLESSATHWRRGRHWYNDVPMSGLDLSLDRPNARALGLLLAARLLRPLPEQVSVRLLATPDEVTELVLDTAEFGGARSSLTMRVTSFHYEPRPLVRFPLCAGAYSFNWPRIALTGWQPSRGPAAPLQTVHVSGTEAAFADLAQVFLDAGCPASEAVEFDLENFDVGNGGVRVGSVDLKVWLPGSIGYRAGSRP